MKNIILLIISVLVVLSTDAQIVINEGSYRNFTQVTDAGGSRTQLQLSFRIEPGNSALGDGDVRFPLIPILPKRMSYANFYLRNGSNQYLYYPCKDAIETIDFGLKDKGEWIRAYDSSGKLRLSVRYNDIEPWPVLAGGMGYTLELVDSAGIMNDGTNWMTGCIGGSPGRYHTSDCSGSGIADKPQITDVTVYPNPTSDKIHITISGIIPIRVTLKNLLGETVMYSEETTGQTELSLRHLSAGSYILTVHKLDGSRQNLQVIKQ
ncbi:MAG: T9SS type A sorting domain-containing protein [Bacteroidales bacterium]